MSSDGVLRWWLGPTSGSGAIRERKPFPGLRACPLRQQGRGARPPGWPGRERPLPAPSEEGRALSWQDSEATRALSHPENQAGASTPQTLSAPVGLNFSIESIGSASIVRQSLSAAHSVCPRRNEAASAAAAVHGGRHRHRRRGYSTWNMSLRTEPTCSSLHSSLLGPERCPGVCQSQIAD